MDTIILDLGFKGASPSVTPGPRYVVGHKRKAHEVLPDWAAEENNRLGFVRGAIERGIGLVKQKFDRISGIGHFGEDLFNPALKVHCELVTISRLSD
jgi:hypothetical protein